MGDYPNLREFYQKGLIVIGENDRASLKEKAPPNSSIEGSTHWLIAMEGTEKRPDVFQWKVLVYTSETNGVIPYHSPYYSSQYFTSIHDAIAHTTELGVKASQDQLSSIH